MTCLFTFFVLSGNKRFHMGKSAVGGKEFPLRFPDWRKDVFKPFIEHVGTVYRELYFCNPIEA
jgi:hypothetical protein